MNTGDRIKKLRVSKGMTQEDLGVKLGVKKSAIAKYENNRVANLKKTTIQKLAEIFNVTPSYLLGIEDDVSFEDTNFIKVPQFSEVSCGLGEFVEDDIIDYVTIPAYGLNPNKDYFCQRASGDSMINEGINDGDIIVFEKTNTIEDGKIGCFIIDDGIATCKKFKKSSSYIQLIPANTKYDPIIIDPTNTYFRVIGQLKKAIKEFN